MAKHVQIAITYTNYLAESKVQKQPSRGVLIKRCSENMQQIYRKTPMPSDMVKHEIRVTSCELRVTSYELKA